MDKLNLPQILRYLLIGFILIGAHYICFPTEAVKFYSELGKAGTPILAFVTGALTFLIYRSVIYGVIILRLIDKIHSDNVRSILRSRYEIPSWYKAEALSKVIQEAELEERLKNIDLGSAGTHLLYMTAIAAFGATVILFIHSETGLQFWLALAVSIIFAISAVVSDYYIETIETLLLKSIDSEKIDAFAIKMGFNKKASEPPATH